MIREINELSQETLKIDMEETNEEMWLRKMYQAITSISENTFELTGEVKYLTKRPNTEVMK